MKLYFWQFQTIFLVQKLIFGHFWNCKKWNLAKKFFREIAFLTVSYFSQVHKLIFGEFWNCKKWNLAKKIFVKLIYSISWVFFGLDFFLIFWPTVNVCTPTTLPNKNEIWPKKFSWNWFILLHDFFFGQDFFTFSGPLCIGTK